MFYIYRITTKLEQPLEIYRVSINDCGIQVGFECVPTVSPEIE
jgi:hypothetical protein